jgi:DNA-binding HxlR family transcriptional regulator
MELWNTAAALGERHFDELKTIGGGPLGQAAPPGRDGQLESADPMHLLLSVLAGPWTLYLAWTLLRDGPKRFSELRRLIPGISSKVLTERLRLLESEHYLVRKYHTSGTAKVTYEATLRLQELTPILLKLRDLAADWYADPASKVNGLARAAGHS